MGTMPDVTVLSKCAYIYANVATGRGSVVSEMKVVPANAAGVVEAVEFVKGFLAEHGIKKRELSRAMHSVEESVGSLEAHANPGSEIRV